MVLDSSAIVAIHLKEPGHEVLTDRIDAAAIVIIGAPTLVATTMVLSARLALDARPLIVDLLRRVEAEVVPFNEQHAETAVRAFLLYGRGHHPAALNFGDCMSYAVASVAEQPLLFTGDDFARTDIARE